MPVSEKRAAGKLTESKKCTRRFSSRAGSPVASVATRTSTQPSRFATSNPPSIPANEPSTPTALFLMPTNQSDDSAGTSSQTPLTGALAPPPKTPP